MIPKGQTEIVKSEDRHDHGQQNGMVCLDMSSSFYSFQIPAISCFESNAICLLKPPVVRLAWHKHYNVLF